MPHMVQKAITMKDCFDLTPSPSLSLSLSLSLSHFLLLSESLSNHKHVIKDHLLLLCSLSLKPCSITIDLHYNNHDTLSYYLHNFKPGNWNDQIWWLKLSSIDSLHSSQCHSWWPFRPRTPIWSTGYIGGIELQTYQKHTDHPFSVVTSDSLLDLEFPATACASHFLNRQRYVCYHYSITNTVHYFFRCALLHREIENTKDIMRIITTRNSTATALTVPATITVMLDVSLTPNVGSEKLVGAKVISSGKQVSYDGIKVSPGRWYACMHWWHRPHSQAYRLLLLTLELS